MSPVTELQDLSRDELTQNWLDVVGQAPPPFLRRFAELSLQVPENWREKSGTKIRLKNPRLSGGETGIRTLETIASLHTFQACAFDHSATSQLRRVYSLAASDRKTCHCAELHLPHIVA